MTKRVKKQQNCSTYKFELQKVIIIIYSFQDNAI